MEKEIEPISHNPVNNHLSMHKHGKLSPKKENREKQRDRERWRGVGDVCFTAYKNTALI